MWIPESESELRNIVESGAISETSTFDAKRELPAPARSKDLAKDVAAMANDGGVLLYGVSEGAEGRPTVCSPIPINGVRERIDAVVRSAISEPPVVDIRVISTATDSTVGYVVLVIPPSPRAPHMVTKDKDSRYYGRSATGNVVLTEGEVARLYQRRNEWDIDIRAELRGEIERSPVAPDPGWGYLHLVIRPVVPDEARLDRARGEAEARSFLTQLINDSSSQQVFPTNLYSPDVSPDGRWERTVRGWKVEREFEGHPLIRLEVDSDGSAHLFCRAAAREYTDGEFVIIEDLVAGITTRLLNLVGGLYDSADYLGQVATGVAVTGLKGAISSYMRHHVFWRSYPFGDEEYIRTERFSALELRQNASKCAARLVMPLCDATTQGNYKTFEEMSTNSG